MLSPSRPQVRRLRNGKSLPEGDHSAASEADGLFVTQRAGGMIGPGSPKAGDGLSLPKTESQFALWHLEREKEKEDRAGLVLWRRPFQTLYYCLLELGLTIKEYSLSLLQRRRLILFLLLLTSCLVGLNLADGPHQLLLTSWRKHVMIFLYWIGLGILSSVGLGTGLHTFLLYLGPFIAQVTMAAFECNSLDFPEPPYPDQIICPTDAPETSGGISLLAIMSKVRWEAFMWGAGTAIGELPPYFMARAARLSGLDPDDEEFDEFAELMHEQQQRKDGARPPLFHRLKLGLHQFVQRVGFFGILVCASVPNPLFDLAGITCGHFLIPFWTFFGATLIGKAVIKMHIQKLFVIIAFSKHHMEMLLRGVGAIPWAGAFLRDFLEGQLAVQREKFRKKAGDTPAPVADKNWIGWIFEKFVILMICYFVLSLINSMAQNYHKRLYKRHRTAPAGEKMH